MYRDTLLIGVCIRVVPLCWSLVSPTPHITEERRLFVGMLSRDLSEDDVRLMFSQFGQVEDVSILRNAQGTSKGSSLFLHSLHSLHSFLPLSSSSLYKS